MAVRKRVTVEGISFDPAGPTAVAIGRLYNWVIWQFPRVRPGGFSGAVHPPDPNHGWYPAIIDAAAGQVLVFAHVPERFPSPEAAAKHIDQNT